MSALTDPKGFKLTTLVEAQRGMTESETIRYLETGTLPDLSKPPIDVSDVASLPLDRQVLPLDVVTDWLAGRYPGALVASVLGFKFNPNQPRDSEGKWTDGAPGVSAPDFKSPGGTSSAPSQTSPVGKKITPAVIYKKHADGAIVAEAPGQRMRWDAGAKKFVVEKKVALPQFIAPKTRARQPTGQWPFSYEVEPDVQAEYGNLAQMSDEAYEKAGGYHLINLPVSALVPTQEDDEMDWGDGDEYGMTGKPFVIDINGELFLIDGHHRAKNAGRYGQLQVWVKPIEMKSTDDWQEIARLTKTAAYEDTKVPERWFEPGTVEVTMPDTQSEVAPSTLTNADALKAWQGADHDRIQKALRNGETTPEVPLLDQAIENSKPLGSTEVYRALTPGSLPPELMTPGAVFTDLGYTATSTEDPKDSALFKNYEHITISVPKGAKGYRFKSGPYKELLLPRGSQLRVDSVDDSRRMPGSTLPLHDVHATLLVDELSVSSQTPESAPSVAEPTAKTTGFSGIDALRDDPLITKSLADKNAFMASHGGLGVPNDIIMEAIVERRGFDGKPKIVSESAVDAALRSGQPELMRAFQQAEHADNFKTGPFYGGIGDQGSGTYFSYRPGDFDPLWEARLEEYGPERAKQSDQELADFYQESVEEMRAYMRKRAAKIANRMRDITQTYGQTVLRGTLSPDVDVKTYDEVVERQRAYVKQLEDELVQTTDLLEREKIDRWIRVVQDEGRFAALDGVRAYYGRTPGELIVVDRGAVQLQDDPLHTYAPSDFEVKDVSDSLTAAAEVHTGAMIALVPTEENARRIAVDGGEDADQLHLTLCYLGEAALIPPEVREQLIDCVTECATRLPTIVGSVFAISAFNPVTAAAGAREPCVTALVSGSLLQRAHSVLAGDVYDTLDQSGVAYPTPHSPWIPHITLLYTDDADVSVFTDRIGTVTFDHVRLAFGGDVYDIPLGDHISENGAMLTSPYDAGGEEE